MNDLPNSPACLRLMILAPFAPRLDTPHGGGRVLAQFLLEISQRHRVALLYMQGSDDSPIDPVLLERCDLAHMVTRPWAARSLAQRVIRNLRLGGALLRGKPMWVADWESPEFASMVRSVAHSWQPDLVQLDYNIMGQYLPMLEDCLAPRVLVEYEPASLAGPFLQIGPQFIRRLAHRFDQKAWRRFEPEVIRQVQGVVAFTPKDQQAICDYGLSTPVSLIPFGTSLASQPFHLNSDVSASLLFIGNFVHPPNYDAAMRLIRDIFPAVRKKHPQLTCTIVGPNPPADFGQQAGDGVTVTGWVPDLAPYLERAAVFVAPLRLGGGMRVKILETMAAGKAIVTTRLAVEGLSVQDGEHVFLAESDAEITARIEQLLANPDQRRTLAANARAWACANLGWEKTIQAYERLYQRLLSEGRR